MKSKATNTQTKSMKSMWLKKIERLKDFWNTDLRNWRNQ
ncbi:MAG: hypothetical protein ACI9FW_000606 [Flavobacterium sp.]|jgi:hypothetical protein